MNLLKKRMLLICVVLMSACITANAQMNLMYGQQSFVEQLPALEPISFHTQKPYTVAEVRRGIISGVLRHGWEVESETPDAIRVKLDGRSDRIVLVMDVVYDITGYHFKYVTSDEHPVMLGKYEGWMNNLARAINTELRIIELQ